MWLTSIGGVLISIAGVALAALTLGSPILPADTVLLVIVPSVFTSTLLMTLGLMLTRPWLGFEQLKASVGAGSALPNAPR